MVGIVVLNYETWEISIRCLQSIHRTCEGYPYRIYLVDNDSKRPMPRQIRNELCKRKEQVCLIKAGQNRGYAAGNNLGMRQALADQCEVIVIANNDILFQKQAIQRLAAFLKKYPKVGIAGPKIVNEKGEVQISRFGMYTGIQEMFQIYTAAKKIFWKKWNRYYCLDRDADKASYVYAVSGCCFAVSRECAKVIFPLDEQTVLYFEEPIIGIRMEKQDIVPVICLTVWLRMCMVQRQDKGSLLCTSALGRVSCIIAAHMHRQTGGSCFSCICTGKCCIFCTV